MRQQENGDGGHTAKQLDRYAAKVGWAGGPVVVGKSSVSRMGRWAFCDEGGWAFCDEVVC